MSPPRIDAMVRGLFLALVASCAWSSSLRMLSLNTLSAGDTFSTGWGTVGEMARRDELVAGGMDETTARRFLLSTRYQRVASFLRQMQSSHNALALQEIDLPNVTGGEHLLKYFDTERGSWRVACNVANPTEQEMVLVNTKEIQVLSNDSWTEEGVVGCATKVRIRGSNNNEALTLMSFHMKASFIRNPDKVNATLLRFMATMPSDRSTVIAAGDFNVNIPELVERIELLDNTNQTWHSRTAANGTTLGFTTQHEYNFLGAYDGFITRQYTPQSQDMTTVWEQGLMPKYLGYNATTYGQSPFRYAGGPYPSVNGNLLFNEKDLGTANAANASVSDHLAVTSTFYTRTSC